MKKINVNIFSALDKLRFKNLKEKRETEIDISDPKQITRVYKINKHAKELHPDYQELKVDYIDVISEDVKTYTLSSSNGKQLAYFRAGQALSLKFYIDKSFASRTYSICSSPKEVEDGIYKITVKRKQNGFISNYILDTFKEGTRVIASAPYGNFYYQKLRDNKNVVAVCGGSGITPILSLAKAINDGIEDFNLTILYGNKNLDSILFKNALDDLQYECNKIKVIYVLSDEVKENYESGLITAELIKKYSTAPYSIFVSGSYDMQEYISKEISKLVKPNKEIRFDFSEFDGDITKSYNYPKEVLRKTFKIKVKQGLSETVINALPNETILTALEKAGIKAPSKCRTGECGWCRSKLVIGEVYCNNKNIKRRYTDIESNYIHPCCCYPIADCTIEVPFEYI